MPLANAYLQPEQLETEEPRYPLHVLVCDQCLLVQLEAVVSPAELFTDYAYFSSYSESWIEHGRRFAVSVTVDLDLDSTSQVVEVASNDGYLLAHFQAWGIPVLGIEPAANVARAATAKGIPTETAFFGRRIADELVQRGSAADLLIANNVLAHVPDLHDFLAGLATILKPTGVLSIEVPHLLRLLAETQFDTIYHEHFSYFSLLTAERALAQHGLVVFDVEQLSTHGGSLRMWCARKDTGRQASARVVHVRTQEEAAGLDDIGGYSGFDARVEGCRKGVVDFLRDTRAGGKTVVAYGAAAKGNTLLNFCTVGPADIAYVADRSIEKQGRYLPGSHLLVEPPDRIFETRPDFVAILPWNLREEIASQLEPIRSWGGRFVTFVPEVQVLG